MPKFDCDPVRPGGSLPDAALDSKSIYNILPTRTRNLATFGPNPFLQAQQNPDSIFDLLQRFRRHPPAAALQPSLRHGPNILALDKALSR